MCYVGRYTLFKVWNVTSSIYHSKGKYANSI